MKWWDKSLADLKSNPHIDQVLYRGDVRGGHIHLAIADFALAIEDAPKTAAGLTRSFVLTERKKLSGSLIVRPI